VATSNLLPSFLFSFVGVVAKKATTAVITFFKCFATKKVMVY
jgi:hypothetical protein